MRVFLYNPQRSRNLFIKDQEAPFKLSRSKIDDFLKCPRCFYLDRRCGTGRPPSFPFTLNNAVDALLKNEFDKFRLEGRSHPLCLENGVDAIPFAHPDLEDWRMNQRGIQYLHEPTQFIITGAIDDVWINPEGELIIVDYKATSSKEEITLDKEYRQSYKRQMEIYQWLFAKNGFRVSKTGYFVYCNADANRDNFSSKLEFAISVLPYEGDSSWIEETLMKVKECLIADKIPEHSSSCDYCLYWQAIKEHVTTENQI
jgi:hypothetical protein